MTLWPGEKCGPLCVCLAPGAENLSVFSSPSGHCQYVIVKMKKGEQDKYFCEEWYVGTVTYQFNRTFSSYDLTKTF